MSHNKKYLKTKFKVMFGNMKSPTMYAELNTPVKNQNYTKTFQNENNEIISEFITIDEYAAALGHILLRENGYNYLQNKNNNIQNL